MFKARRVIEGMLHAFVNAVQTLEGHTYDVIVGRLLENAVGNQLDVLARIVGEPKRNGRSDDEMRSAIGLRVLINKSDGSVQRLVKITATAAESDSWQWFPMYPAGFAVLLVGSVTRFKVLRRAVEEAKATATRSDAMYDAGPLSELFIPSSTLGTVSTALGPSHTTGLPRSVPVHVESD